MLNNNREVFARSGTSIIGGIAACGILAKTSEKHSFSANRAAEPQIESMTFEIKSDDLSSPEIAALLQEHLRDMHELSPPESVHALDLDELRKPDITFWSVWSGDDLVGCGALKEMDKTQGEIKSMRTANKFRGKGAGKFMLRHIMDEARTRGYTRLSLETGSMDAFEPARRLYASHGFTICGPFGDYILDPHSVFMSIGL